MSGLREDRVPGYNAQETRLLKTVRTPDFFSLYKTYFEEKKELICFYSIADMRSRWISILLCAVSALATPMRDVGSLLSRDEPIDDSGDAGYPPENYTICDYSASFNSLFDLNVAIAAAAALGPATGSLGGLVGQMLGGGTLRSDCVSAYAMGAVINMLNSAWANYTTISEGYDKEFGFYIKYMEKTVPSIIDNVFMFDASKATATESIAPVGPGMQCKTAQFLVSRRNNR